jgi:hypothetical protein
MAMYDDRDLEPTNEAQTTVDEMTEQFLNHGDVIGAIAVWFREGYSDTELLDKLKCIKLWVETNPPNRD